MGHLSFPPKLCRRHCGKPNNACQNVKSKRSASSCHPCSKIILALESNDACFLLLMSCIMHHPRFRLMRCWCSICEKIYAPTLQGRLPLLTTPSHKQSQAVDVVGGQWGFGDCRPMFMHCKSSPMRSLDGLFSTASSVWSANVSPPWISTRSVFFQGQVSKYGMPLSIPLYAESWPYV